MTPETTLEGLDIEHGEAIEVLRAMPAMSVDLTLTDPPYFLPATHYSTPRQWPRSLADLAILEHFYRDLFAEVRRVSKPDGRVAVFCDGQSYPVFFSLLYPHWPRLREIVWDKEHLGMGSGIRRQHELILVGYDGHKLPGPWVRSVIKARRVGADRTHPVEKPVPLLLDLVRLLSKPGGLVLDPFAGSGSTGLAAKLAGREFRGVELNADYAAGSAGRICDEQPRLLG